MKETKATKALVIKEAMKEAKEKAQEQEKSKSKLKHSHHHHEKEPSL